MTDAHPSFVMISETVNKLRWPEFTFLNMMQAGMKLIKAVGLGDVTPASLSRHISVYVYKYMQIEQCCYEGLAWSALPRKTGIDRYMIYLIYIDISVVY